MRQTVTTYINKKREVNIVKYGFERRLLMEEESLEDNYSVTIERDSFKVLQWQVELSRSAEDSMFWAYCSDGNMS